MRFKTSLLLAFLIIFGASSVFAQDKFDENGKKEKPTKTPAPQKIDFKKGLKTGPQVAEFSILVYGNLRGRIGLNQIRKTTVEVGKLKTTNADGTVIESTYETTIKRAKDYNKEQIRFNQKLPSAEYALIYNGDKIFGIFNNTVFTPREDAAKAFQNRIWHSLEALLRYNESGATVKLEGEKTLMGVDFYKVAMTAKDKRKTDYYVSKKSLRVMMLEYEEDGVKYRRKYYDHNYAQGTLVPYRSVLWADGKIREEQTIQTITYGQTLDDGLFEEVKG
ncbi:MAG: hypothetical protein HKN25_08560 [Pyrinomonadaceae bacterium]|nr:hypothetical protein [Pyrinomonadaceae bacterium]